MQSKTNEVEAAVECAIDSGYRHIDCAWAYENEHEVGNAISKKIKEGKVKREDLFVVTKVGYFKIYSLVFVFLIVLVILW